MATFGELWTAILPAALPLFPLDAVQLRRDVGWVRILKARVPAFDALDAGDVAIVPLAALEVVAPGPVETATLVEALAAARSAGILLVDGDEEGSGVSAVRDAVAAVGMPALRVGRVDTNQLERSVIGFLVNRRAELEHQAAVLEGTLEEVALGTGDVAALIAAVAGFLGRAVALEGRRGEVAAVHAPEQAPGAAAAVSAYLGGSRSAALRVSLPGSPGPSAGSSSATPSSGAAVGSRGAAASPAGRLLLLGDRPPSDLERVVAPRVARLIALELARADALRRAQDAGRRADALPAEGPPWVMLVARQVSSVAGSSIEAREEIRSRLRIVAPPSRLALRGDAESLELRLVFAVPAGDAVANPPATTTYDVAASTLARQVADLLDRPVALSRPFADPAGRPAAEAEARATLEAIEALPDPPRVARSDRLPAYRLRASLMTLPDGVRHARTLLEPLMRGGADARRERLATIRAVLDQPGFAEAAAALGVHRNTLAYRIRRIEEITGWSLADPDLRLPLAIAVRLVGVDRAE
jgi:purine catabolism regulator